MSSLEALTQHGTLTVCVDITDPYSLLALPRTMALLQQVRQHANWRCARRPAMQPPGNPQVQEDRSTTHRRLRAEYRERELQHYAAALQLPLLRLYEYPDCDAFVSALHWLGSVVQSAPAVPVFLLHTFRTYWGRELDISDCDSLAECITRAGASSDEWLSHACRNGQLTDSARARAQDDLAQWRSAGIFNTPAYLYNGEVFYGRAHLPVIEQLLMGKPVWTP